MEREMLKKVMVAILFFSILMLSTVGMVSANGRQLTNYGNDGRVVTNYDLHYGTLLNGQYTYGSDIYEDFQLTSDMFVNYLILPFKQINMADSDYILITIYNNGIATPVFSYQLDANQISQYMNYVQIPLNSLHLQSGDVKIMLRYNSLSWSSGDAYVGLSKSNTFNGTLYTLDPSGTKWNLDLLHQLVFKLSTYR